MCFSSRRCNVLLDVADFFPDSSVVENFAVFVYGEFQVAAGLVVTKCKKFF